MRPSRYSEAVVNEICERLAVGETMVSICRDDHMPGLTTVAEWRRAKKDFDDRYRQAMLDGCHALLDETLSIADDKGEDASSRKVRIWARHELIKRKRPDVFSDRVAMTGFDGGAIEHNAMLTVRFVDKSDGSGTSD